MIRLQEIIREAAAAALGARVKFPEPGTYNTIGRVVDAIQLGEEAGIDVETLRRDEMRWYYKEGLTRYRVDFSRRVQTGGPFYTRAAAIPLEFHEVAISNVGRMTFCNIVFNRGKYEVRELAPFTG